MFNLFAQIRKVDEAQRLVFGRAAQEVADKSGEIMDYASSKPHFQKWSEDISKDTGGKSLGNVRAMHGKVAAGKLTSIDFNDEDKAVDVCAKIVDDQEWKKVLEGVYTGFSIGGKYIGDKKVEKMNGQDVTRYTAGPSELSLVDRPCIPSAKFFEVQKADGSLAKVEFQKAADPTPEGTVKAAQKASPDGTGLNAAAEAAPKHEAPGHPKTQAALKASGAASDAASVDDDDDDGDAADVADSHTTAAAAHTDAGEAHKDAGNKHAAAFHGAMADYHEAQAGAAEKMDGVVEGTAAEVDALTKLMADNKLNMAKVLEAVAASLEKKEFSDKARDKAAKSGAALPDGSFPINTVADLQNAIKAYGRAKDKAKVKAHIEERAKALGAEKELPDSWEKIEKAAAARALRKDMYSASTFAQLIAALIGLQKSAEYESAREGDDSDLPDRLAACVTLCGEVLKEMIDEELSENDNDNAQTPASPTMFSMAEQCGELVKMYKGDPLLDLVKIGARHSAADKSRVQAIHDASADLGADCAAAKVAAPSDLAKADGWKEELSKAITEATEPLQKALTEATEKITKLEAQPAPSRIKLRAVSKGEDFETGAVEKVEVKPVVDGHGEQHEAAGLIKSMHQQGGAPLHVLNK